MRHSTAETKQSWSSGQDAFLDWNWKNHTSTCACTDFSQRNRRQFTANKISLPLDSQYLILIKTKPGIWTQKKKPQHSLCFPARLVCFSALPAVPVQICRGQLSSPGQGGCRLRKAGGNSLLLLTQEAVAAFRHGGPWVPQPRGAATTPPPASLGHCLRISSGFQNLRQGSPKSE